jgi:putative oxidoreductase
MLTTCVRCLVIVNDLFRGRGLDEFGIADKSVDNHEPKPESISMQQNVVALVGRVLLSIIFIVAGYGKLTALGGTAGYFGSIGLPVPMITAVLVTAVELLGGIAILVGFFTRPAAYILALFCVASAFIGHGDFSVAGNDIHIMKNLAMAGGFLFVATFGPGSLSVDARRGVAAAA